MKIKTVKDLKALIEHLPDDMSVGLLDLSTEDSFDSTYGYPKVEVGDCYKEPDDSVPSGKALWITFENKLQIA